MAARALWKAELKVGSSKVAVRLYSAVEDRTTHFHLLHAADRERVHERVRRADDGELVESSEAHSGYALDSGELVLLDRKDLTAIAPKPSRTIDVLQCVGVGVLPMAAFARPYWLGPDGDEAGYFALAEALNVSERLAIVEWVMRSKHHYGALCARDQRLMLVELRSADQWLDLKNLQTPAGAATNAREVAMAEQLIAGLEGAFDHAAFHDTYRESVHALVETKARGGKVPKARPPRRAEPASSLSAALSASLRAMKKPTSSKERKHA